MKQRLKAVQLRFWVVLLFAFFALRSSAQFCPTTKVCVLTWQQDTGTDIGAGYSYRTGQNLNESKITAELFPSDFGQLCSAQLDGQVYSVPTVANGYVYLGTQSSNGSKNESQGTFYILGPGRTC